MDCRLARLTSVFTNIFKYISSMHSKSLFFTAIALILSTVTASAQNMTVVSPDGKLKFDMTFDSGSGKIA